MDRENRQTRSCPVCGEYLEEGLSAHRSCSDTEGFENYRTNDSSLSPEERKKRFIEVRNAILAGITFNGGDAAKAVINDECSTRGIDSRQFSVVGCGGKPELYNGEDWVLDAFQNYDWGHDRILQDSYFSLLIELVKTGGGGNDQGANQYYPDQIVRRLQDIGLRIDNRPDLKEQLAREIDKKFMIYLDKEWNGRPEFLTEVDHGGDTYGIEDLFDMIDRHGLTTKTDLLKVGKKANAELDDVVCQFNGKLKRDYHVAPYSLYGSDILSERVAGEIIAFLSYYSEKLAKKGDGSAYTIAGVEINQETVRKYIQKSDVIYLLSCPRKGYWERRAKDRDVGINDSDLDDIVHFALRFQLIDKEDLAKLKVSKNVI